MFKELNLRTWLKVSQCIKNEKYALSLIFPDLWSGVFVTLWWLCSLRVCWGILFSKKLSCFNLKARLSKPLWEHMHSMFYVVFHHFWYVYVKYRISQTSSNWQLLVPSAEKGAPWGQDLTLSLNIVNVCYQDLVTHCEYFVEKEMDEELHIQYWKTSLPELRQSKNRSRSHFGRKDGHRLWGSLHINRT